MSYLYSLLSGLLLGLAFPPSAFGVLSFLAYVPLIVVICRESEDWGKWKTFAMLYVPFVVYHVMANWWVSSWQENTDPYLYASGFVLDALHPLFLIMPWAFLVRIRRKLGPTVFIVCTPFAIAGFEWLHGQTDASYPWLTSGYALIDTPFAQVAELCGVYGLSFLLGIVNIFIALAVMNYKRKKMLVAVIAMLLVWLGGGLVLQWKSESALTNGGRVRIGLIQPNENPWDKWSDPRVQVSNHMKLVDSTQAHLRGESTPDVYVWSETAIPFLIRKNVYAEEFNSLRNWIDTSGITLLTGYADYVAYQQDSAPPSARRSQFDSTLRFDAFNAAMVLWPNITDIPVHRKTNLTPFAERLPFADQLTFAMSWIEWGVGISAWGKGRVRSPLPIARAGTSAFNLDTIANVGVIICIESVYPETARDFVNNGADVLCVITNDAWYNGTPGPRQHYDIARMRAIEERRWIMRCGNSGITGVIDQSGASVSEMPPQTTGVHIGTVRRNSEKTVYAIVGDVIPPLGLIMVLLAWILARFPRLIRKMPFLTSTNNPD